MKKLQNDFTTPEQSKRLLELGVPADSADCYYVNGNGLNNLINIRADEYEQSSDIWSTDNGYVNSPCWSVGRLIEIFELCTGKKFERRMDRPIVEDVKCRIAFYIFHNKFDFSKLEE